MPEFGAGVPGLQEKLRLLEEKFAAKLPERLNELAQVLKQLQGQRQEQEQDRLATASHLAVLRQMLHDIAGSAGTFGFAVLGQGARLLETQCDALTISARAQRLPTDEALAALLSELAKFVASAKLDPKGDATQAGPKQSQIP